jgi:hypothetical protein
MLWKNKQIRFIVMGNVFCSEYRIHKRFDLKGSSHGRITDKPREEIDETTTLKDLDLDLAFRLEQSWFQELKWYGTYLVEHFFLPFFIIFHVVLIELILCVMVYA